MIRKIFLILCLVVSPSFCFGEEQPTGLLSVVENELIEPVVDDETPFSLYVRTDIWSEYVFEGLKSSDDPVIQTELLLSMPYGFYVDLWHSAGLNDSDLSSDYADELDYTLGWAGTLADLGLGREDINVDIGVIYFDLVDIFKSQDDIIRAYLRFDTEVMIGDQAVTFYVQPEVNWTVNSDLEGGGGVEFGAEHSIEIVGSLSYDHALRIYYDSGTAGLDAGFIGEYAGGLTWMLNDNINVIPIQFKASTPLEALSDDRETEIIFGAAIEFSF